MNTVQKNKLLMFDELAAVNDGHTTEVESVVGLKDTYILFKSTLSCIRISVPDQIIVISGFARENKWPGVFHTVVALSLTILYGPLIHLIKRVYVITVQQIRQEITNCPV
jgi:hypothetical protein